MRLSEFDFEIQLKKGLLNTKADAKSYLRSLRETTVSVDADISTYPLLSDATPNNRNRKYNLNLELEFTTDTSPSFVSLTLEEVRLSQSGDAFCLTMLACLGEEKRVPFALNKDNVLFRSFDGFEKMAIHQSQIPPVLHLKSRAKMAEKQGGRQVHQFLYRIFFWPNISSDCYAILEGCVSCAKNRMTLRRK